MGLSIDVTLPKSIAPRFPDRCVCCGVEGPGTSIRLMTNSTGLLRVVIVWPGRRFSVDVPCCDDCSLAVTRQRRLRGAVTWIAIVAAVVLALEFLDDLPRHARKWAVMGLVLAGVSPLIGWQVFFPPIVDITAHSDRVDYEFKDARYAAEFASLNGSTIDG